MSNYYVFKEGKWFKNGQEVPAHRVKEEIPSYIRYREQEIIETFEREEEYSICYELEKLKEEGKL